ncbi:MAG: VOC family protein [Anaerolineales bacterium]
MVGPLIEIILYVEDMNREVHFYRDLLGLPVRYPARKADLSAEGWVTLGEGDCVLALHAGGKGRLGEDTPKIVFRVEDIHTARATLSDRGVALREIRRAAPGVWVCDGADPEGHPFSIEEHEEGH